MTTEERLARLEERAAMRDARLEKIEEKLDELLKAAHWGQGVGWTFLKIGSALVGIAAVLKVVIDAVRH